MTSWAGSLAWDTRIDRLFGIVRIIAASPGIGFDALRAALPGRWSKPTLHKDLRILKDLGILDDRRHRSGYFIGRTSFALDEIPAVLAGLQVLGEDLRHPGQREWLQRVQQRLRQSLPGDGTWAYPVVAVGNRVIVETMHTGMHELMSILGEMIVEGRQVRIRQVANPWQNPVARYEDVYPLQLVFHEIAWYLLAERGPGDFAAFRIDRLSPFVTLTDAPVRGLQDQRAALDALRRRMRYAWGMTVPPDEDDLVDLVVRFLPPAAHFVREGKRRHPAIVLTDEPGLDGSGSDSVLMTIRLHRSSVRSFSWWVLSWGKSAEVVADGDLRRFVFEQAKAIVAREAARSS